MIAKKLLEEGEKAWNLISQNSNRVQWDNAVFGIEEQFMRIACCSSRSLTQQVTSTFQWIAHNVTHRNQLSPDNAISSILWP